MNHQLPPVPPVDAFYEWLLCDATAAQEERARRRSRNAADAEHERAQVTAWCQRTFDNAAAPPNLRDLAEVMQRLVSRGQTRERAEGDVDDDAWVRRERRQYEASRRVAGDHDYRYPARYLGPDAADQPVPDERVPVHALEQRQRVRLGPSRPPAVVAAVEACGDGVLLYTTDGQRRRYPATAWAA
ncbi:hypothetical protein BH20ACT8_BH20ACT8_02070 [soil metagenome]